MRNLNVKANPVTTILGVINGIFFVTVLLGFISPQTSEQVMLIVTNLAAAFGTEPPLIIGAMIAQGLGSAVLLIARDPNVTIKRNKAPLILIPLAVGLSLASCSKEEQVIPASHQAKLHEESQEYTQANERLLIQLAHLSSQEDEITAAKGGQTGTDSTINLKPNFSVMTFGASKFLVFRLSIDNGNDTLAQMNSMYYTIHFTGNLQPTVDPVNHIFHHSIWPPSAINYSSGILLENVIGQSAVSSWFSLSPLYLPSSTGQASYGGMPVVAWIAFSGTQGTISLDTDPNATGFSKDGWNNYRMAPASVTVTQ